jgi:hypothetical protein
VRPRAESCAGKWLDVIHCHSTCGSDRKVASGMSHEECEKVSRMSVGGVFSYPRPRRERGVDSPGVRAVGESPWWRQTPNCMYAVCIPAIATVLRGKRFHNRIL